MDEAVPRRRRRAWVVMLVMGAVLIVPLLLLGGVFVLARTTQFGCCGPPIDMGEIWYCRAPDAEHPAGERFLLETRPEDWAVGEPLRLETGYVGTPLQWRQEVGSVVLSVDLDVPPHTNSVVAEESETAVVRKNEVTPVLSPAGATGCPTAPTAVATPWS